MGALQTTRMALDSDGRLEVFVPCVGSGDSMQLWQLYQTAPAGGWSGWVNHGAPSSATEPYVGFGPFVILDGHELDVIMGFGSSAPRGPWQISQTPTGWTQTWTPLGIPAGTTDVNNYALAARSSGDLELFVVSVTDPPVQTYQLWRLGQFTGSDDWNRWSTLGCPSPGGPLAPVVAASADGRLEVFTVAADGALWHIWETTLNGTWSDWTSHGYPPQSLGFTNTPVIAANSEGRLELLLTGNDFQVWHIYQTAPSGGWSDWVPHGSPPGTDLNGFTPALAASADGRLEFFATGFDKQLWHINQLRPSGAWCDWYSHPRLPSPAGVGGTPTVALNSAAASNCSSRAPTTSCGTCGRRRPADSGRRGCRTVSHRVSTSSRPGSSVFGSGLCLVALVLHAMRRDSAPGKHPRAVGIPCNPRLYLSVRVGQGSHDMHAFTSAIVTACALAAVAVAVPATAAAVGGPGGYGNAQDTINALQAQGFNVQVNGAAVYPLSGCKVTGIEGMHNDNINAAGAIIDPSKLTTVWVDISCKGG